MVKLRKLPPGPGRDNDPPFKLRVARLGKPHLAVPSLASPDPVPALSSRFGNSRHTVAGAGGQESTTNAALLKYRPSETTVSVQIH